MSKQLIKNIDLRLKNYIDRKIVPLYKKHDRGHDERHMEEVIHISFKIADVVKEEIDPDILYTAAAFHDVGLRVNREDHHNQSGKIVRKLKTLTKWFSPKEIEIIAQACEDHRASSDRNSPRSIYGKIVADGDRSSLYFIERLFERTWYYRIDNFGKESDETIFEDMFNHMVNKFSKDKGYAKIHLNETKKIMKKEITRTQKIIENRDKAYKLFKEMRKDGRLKK